jgi:hypothetical protein
MPAPISPAPNTVSLCTPPLGLEVEVDEEEERCRCSVFSRFAACKDTALDVDDLADILDAARASDGSMVKLVLRDEALRDGDRQSRPLE